MISALHPSSFIFVPATAATFARRFPRSFLTGLSRMNRVPLVEIAMTADVCEQERNEHARILFRDGTKDALKFRLIIRAEIWRHPHSGDDDSNLRILRFRLVDDRLQICFQTFAANPRKPSFAPSAMTRMSIFCCNSQSIGADRPRSCRHSRRR